MDNQLLYDREVPSDFVNLRSEHKKVLEWVGENKKVLEIACHTGYFSAWLVKQNCDVIGLEVFEPALEKAKPYLKKSILGDIEKDQIWQQVAEEKYDVVLYMHILEHLIKPEDILNKTKDILNPGGIVIICLPNISNWVNRWSFFKGNFEYTKVGVMDQTHLKFYNYLTAQNLITSCGFRVEEYSGCSDKVKFRILPYIKGLRRINELFSKFVYSITSPNFHDKVTMFKTKIK